MNPRDQLRQKVEQLLQLPLEGGKIFLPSTSRSTQFIRPTAEGGRNLPPCKLVMLPQLGQLTACLNLRLIHLLVGTLISLGRRNNWGCLKASIDAFHESSLPAQLK